MEQQRLFLLAVLAALSFMLYLDWQKDYGPKPVQPTTQATLPTEERGAAPVQGEQAMPVPSSSAGDTTAKPSTTAAVTATARGEEIIVETDVYRAVIDSQGGDLRQLDLVKYPVQVDKPEQPFRLLDESGQRNFVVQSGFFVIGDQQAQELTPSRQTVFTSAQSKYQITDQARDVDLVWRNREGIEFIIRYTFSPGSYRIKVKHIVNNPGDQKWAGNVYLRLQRTPPVESKSMAALPTYIGPVYYSPDDKYKKINFGDIDDASPKDSSVRDAIDREFTGGWAAMIEHYFVGAWIPPKDVVYRYFTAKLSDSRYLIGLSSPLHEVAPRSRLEVSSDLFVGPKLQKAMEKLAPGLELTVDYGWLTFLAKPLFWILGWIHTLVGNWGWAIILLTLAIKLAFYKLSETSYKSMANMRKLQPKLAAMKQRYGDDKQKMNQAMMEMYKKEKINPLGGCLPILIQIPVFIALYYMLLESVELRQAEWIFWIKDLSVKDPYFVLPIIMGISMLAQQKLNPTPLDPIQAKVMMILPIVFTFLFLFFPSGLVLYWVVNNVLSIAQQWYITNMVIKETKPAN